MEQDNIAAVRHLIFRALIGRGVGTADAEDAAQDAVVRIMTSNEHLARVADLENHRGYFVQMGVHCWFGRLRSERSRRIREERYAHGAPPAIDDEQPRLFELAERVHLTAMQAEYLRMLTEREMSIADIARERNVTERSVHRVVERARNQLRQALQ